MRLNLLYLISIIFALLPSGCSAAPLTLNRIQLYGRMDSGSVNLMKNQIVEERNDGYKGKFLLILTSEGGDADSLFDLMSLFKDEVGYIFIGSKCFSSCAELVAGLQLPVIMGDKSTIGFHNGPTLDYLLAKEYGVKNLECHKKRSDRYREFAKFDIDQADKIKFKSLNVFDVKLGNSNAECQEVSIGMKNKFWFPSTEQLRKIYGLNIDGQVPCSDRQDCLKTKVRELWGAKVRYRMGSKDYSS